MYLSVLWVVIGGLVNLRTCECGQIHISTHIFERSQSRSSIGNKSAYQSLDQFVHWLVYEQSYCNAQFLCRGGRSRNALQWYGNGNLVVLGVTTVTSVCHHQYAGKHQPSAQSKFEVENLLVDAMSHT